MIRQRSRPVVGLVLLAILSILVVGCGSGTGHGPPPWMEPMHRGMRGDWPPAGSPPPSARPGAEEIIVVATEFAFEPATIALDAGRTVNLVLDNRGDVVHDLTIPALGFQLLAPAREKASAALTVTETGTFGFVCSIPGHEAAGMTGVLTVQ